MNYKEIRKRAKEYEKYLSQFPEWYWKHGLHDAKILSVIVDKNYADYNKNRFGKLSLFLDGEGAEYESDITEIHFYNYKFTSPYFDIKNLGNIWWMNDTLTNEAGNRFSLSITISSEIGESKTLSFTFDGVEVKRK